MVGGKGISVAKVARGALGCLLIVGLQGCQTMSGEGGVFVPNNIALQNSVARDFGVDQDDVVISDRYVEGLLGNTTYFTATIKGEKRNCYVSSAIFVVSSPLCAKPGESITSGGNALTRAAGRN